MYGLYTNKINIVTVFNSTYVEFAKLFIESLEKNVGIQHVNTLYVIDTGIKSCDIPLFNKKYIKLINSGVNVNKYKIHGVEWKQCVDSKVKIIKNKILALSTEVWPLVLIDGDSYFLKPFNDLIDTSFDVQIAHRPNEKPKKYIASWVSFNTKQSITLIDKWLDLMKGKNKPPYETDCLIDACKKLKNKIKIGNISTKIISAEEKYKESRILHFKSTGGLNVQQRIKKLLKK